MMVYFDRIDIWLE